MCRAPGAWRFRVSDTTAGASTPMDMWGSGPLCGKRRNEKVTSVPVERTSRASSRTGILLGTFGGDNEPWMESLFCGDNKPWMESLCGDPSMDLFCDWMWISKPRKQAARVVRGRADNNQRVSHGCHREPQGSGRWQLCWVVRSLGRLLRDPCSCG